MKWPLKSFDTEYADFKDIATVPDVFTVDEAAAILDLKSLAKLRVNDGGLAVYREWGVVADWLVDKVTNLLNYVNRRYFGMALDYFSELQINQYGVSGNWLAHSDTIYGAAHDIKKLTLSVQLSEPEAYEGGAFKLINVNIANSHVADRRLGAATIFRSHILHGVEAVTRGTRHSLVAWASGPIPR